MSEGNIGAETDKRYILIAVTLGSFLMPFMGSSIGIALPAIGREFKMDAVLLSWVATAYLVSGTVCLLLFTVYMGRVEIAPPYHDLFMESMKTAFLVFAVLCFGGVFASLARGKVR